MAGEGLPAVGETIGGYRLDRLIATGGMGAVFAATSTRRGTKAAVKVLEQRLAGDREHVSRFVHEARIANDIRHPNIVEIYDIVQTDEHVALVMELLRGPPLSTALLKVKRFTVVQTLNVALQLTDAMAALHRAGVVHRDLKPQNILILLPLDNEFWDVPSIKVLDFGIAKQRDADVEHQTMQGALLGTPAYMAPEQVAGEPVSGATDLYAIGEIMFEMASGRRLFDNENILVLTQKLKNQLPRFDMPKDVPNGHRIAALAKACVAPAPRDRPSMEELREKLTELLEDSEDLEGTEAVHSFLPSTRAPPEEGAATILSMEVPKGDIGAAVPEEPKDSPMNTQMFFDRILDDIAEISQPEPPPPPLAFDQRPGSRLSPLPRPQPGAPASPPVIVGTPVMRAQSLARLPDPAVIPEPKKKSPAPPAPGPKRRRFLWLVMAPALVLIAVVALPGAQDAVRGTVERLLGSTPNPVRRQLAAWKEMRGDVTGTAADHLAAALPLHVQDAWPKYEEAEAAIQRALILEPENLEAIALLAENAIAWREQLLEGPGAGEVKLYLDYVRSRDPAHASLLRAEARLAEVLGETERCRELAQSVREKHPNDPIAMLIEAECTMDRDAAKAEVLIWKAGDAMKELARATRIGARARARNGRYAAALQLLDQRLRGEPKNGPALLEAALIEHAVGLHDRELSRLRTATRADGDRLRAQLLLGKAQAELHKESSARSTLLSLATDERAPARYRREAYLALARIEMAVNAPAKALEQLARAEELGADPELARWKAEALLASGSGAEAFAVLGEPRMVVEQLPAIVQLAGAHLLNSRPDEAKHAFDGAVALAPRDPRLLVYLAGARALLDDFDAARSAMEKTLWLDPLEVLEDDWAPELSAAVGQILVGRLAEMRDASHDPSCVDAVIALLHFYGGRTEEAIVAAARSAAAKNPPRIATILEGHLALGADTRKAEELAAALENDSPTAAGHLLLARLEGQPRKDAADAYAKALGISPELPLAKVERTALDLKRRKQEAVEELLALHVAYPNVRKLRRLLYEAAAE